MEQAWQDEWDEVWVQSWLKAYPVQRGRIGQRSRSGHRCESNGIAQANASANACYSETLAGAGGAVEGKRLARVAPTQHTCKCSPGQTAREADFVDGELTQHAGSISTRLQSRFFNRTA